MARGLKQGMTNNPNGKPKGSKNKVSGKVKDMIEIFLEDNFESFTTFFSEIDNPAVKCKIFLEAAKLILPRPKDIEFENQVKRDELLDRLFPKKVE